MIKINKIAWNSEEVCGYVCMLLNKYMVVGMYVPLCVCRGYRLILEVFLYWYIYLVFGDRFSHCT